MLESRVVRHGAMFLFEVNGQPLPPYAYLSYQPAKADYAGFRSAGVRLFFAAVYAGDRGINQVSGIRPFRPGFWKGPGAFDFSAVEEDFRRIVGDAAPGEVYLIPRLVLELPGWWEDMHPEALCRDAQGTPLHASFSSPAWLGACTEAMEAFQAWLGTSGWHRYVIGWHLAGGNTEEFIRPLLHPMHYLDGSAPAREHFARWLRQQYRHIAALNEAWQETYRDFDEAALPTPAQRRYALHGELRDMRLECRAIDYYRFHSEAMAEAIIALCREAKRITGGRQVMGAFYGYTVNVPNPDNGHGAASRILQSDAVDFLASPFTYMDNRAQGVDWPPQGAVDSAHLHGKPWFLEADVRTHLSRPLGECMAFANPIANDHYDRPVWWGPDTEAGALGQMGKAFARVLAGGTAVWWFDMWGGWYDTPALMAFQQQAEALYREACLGAAAKPAAQIAVFLDEALYADLQPDGVAAHTVVYRFLRQLGWIGAPYHLFLMEDLPRIDPSPYRMAIFPFARHWTAAARAALPRWQTDGRTLLFTGLPGQSAEDAWMLTGFAAHDINDVGCSTFADEAERVDEADPCLPLMNILPDKEHLVLARLTDGRPGLVLRRNTDCQIAWSLPLLLRPERLRELALLSAAHIYSFDGDVVYANSRFVSVHAASEGVKRVYLPRKGSLQDAFTGEHLPGCDTFTDFPMAFGETRLFRVLWRDAQPEGEAP